MGQERGERRRRKRDRPLWLFPFRDFASYFHEPSRKNPGGVLLEMLAGGVPPGSQNPDLISDKKNVIFRTRFQIWPLKSIPVFRLGGDHKTQHKHWHETVTMSSSATKTSLKIHFEFAYYTFFLIQLEFWNDEHINTPPQFLRKLYPIPDQKWAKCILVFQTKTEQEPYPMGRHIPIWLL